MDKLVVAVVGHRNFGKTTTWNTLFGHTVRTGKRERQLNLGNGQSVSVFLVSGSPEERAEYVGDLVCGDPQIVLCSMQYRRDVFDSLDFFVERGYFVFAHWLNPGYSDSQPAEDEHGVIPHLMAANALLGTRNGQLPVDERVDEVRAFIRGWAAGRDLIHTDLAAVER